MIDYLGLLRDGVPFDEVLGRLVADLPFEVEPDIRPRPRTVTEVYLRAEADEATPLGPYGEATTAFAVAMDEGIISEEQYDAVLDAIAEH